jgi:hypothetical protein
MMVKKKVALVKFSIPLARDSIYSLSISDGNYLVMFVINKVSLGKGS